MTYSTNVDGTLVTYSNYPESVVNLWRNCGQESSVVRVDQAFIDSYNAVNRLRYVVRKSDGDFMHRIDGTLAIFYNEIEARRFSYREKDSKVEIYE